MSEAETAERSAVPTRELYRFRIRYKRGEALRYTSHLDMQMVWERTLRRAGVPLAYSHGFSPHPRLHLASALPLGFLSRCELADVWLSLPSGKPAPYAKQFGAQVQAAAPPGLTIQEVQEVALRLPALQTLVRAAEYLALPLDPLDDANLQTAIDRVLAASTLPRERRGKSYDLRPLIEILEICGKHIFMRLMAREGATGRPEEVISALGFYPADFRVERTALILDEPQAET